MKNFKSNLTLALSAVLSVVSISSAAFAADCSSQGGAPPGGRGGPRACDSYIQSLCTWSDDKGPGCLKGHESEVSSACLADIQHMGQRPPQQAQ